MRSFIVPKGNWVLWFKQTIKEFGGEFVPVEVEKSANKHGRREDSILRRRRELVSGASFSKKYFVDSNGTIKKIALTELSQAFGLEESRDTTERRTG